MSEKKDEQEDMLKKVSSITENLADLVIKILYDERIQMQKEVRNEYTTELHSLLKTTSQK